MFKTQRRQVRLNFTLPDDVTSHDIHLTSPVFVEL